MWVGIKKGGNRDKMYSKYVEILEKIDRDLKVEQKKQLFLKHVII